MNAQAERRVATAMAGNQRRDDSGGPLPSLLELLHEGFYMLFLMKNGAKPPYEAGVLKLKVKDKELPRDGAAALATAAAAGTSDAAAATTAAAVTAASAAMAAAALPAAAPLAVVRPSKDELDRTALLDEAILKEKVDLFLAEFDREARKLRAAPDDIAAAKYAFCAALDEVVLGSGLNVWNQWQRRPLQLALFGDQLAGDEFYRRLEELRGGGGAHVQALEVFHMCLLLGFRGRHMHEARDKIEYLTARLGDEIAHIKGKSQGFAPRADRPDQVVNKLRSDVPAWALSALFAVLGLGAYLGLRASLVHNTQNSMAAYADLVRLAPTPANVTITLP